MNTIETGVSIETEIFITQAMLDGLHDRVEREEEFIKRCQSAQRSWVGLVPPNNYNSLDPTTHKKRTGKRRKKDKWHNFFTWGQFNLSPHDVIGHAEERIEELEVKLAELMEIQNG